MKQTEKHNLFHIIALRIIKKKGFKAMTMRDLALEMQCDVANIYNYVKSKDILLENLLFQITDKFHVGISIIENGSQSPLEKIKEIIELHVRLTFQYPNQVSLLVNEWRFLKPEAQNKFIEFRKNYETKLIHIIADGVKNGQIKSDNLEFSCNCILSSLRWIYSWHDPKNTNQNVNETLKMMERFILNGLLG